MIKSVTITNYLGESVKIELSDGDPEHGMIIQNITGLGPPKANVSMTELATMDGSLFNSARVEKRNIVIYMYFSFAPTIEDSRLRTYKYFPIKKPLKFVIETDNRLVETTGIVEVNEPDIFSKDESNQISLVCDDPYFYSAGGNNVTMFFGIEPLFEFEFSNESLNEPLLEFGSIEDKTENTIYYDGDSEVGITMTIHAIGTAGSITIYNTGTRETMKIDAGKIEAMTGFGIIAGDDIIITTVRGNKTISLLRNGKYTNILNALDKTSDWFYLAKGENIFAYTAEYGPENLVFIIENRVVYEGV